MLYCQVSQIRTWGARWGEQSPPCLQELAFNPQWKRTVQANPRCVVHSLGDFAWRASPPVLALPHAVEQLLSSNPVSAAVR